MCSCPVSLHWWTGGGQDDQGTVYSGAQHDALDPEGMLELDDMLINQELDLFPADAGEEEIER